MRVHRVVLAPPAWSALSGLLFVVLYRDKINIGWILAGLGLFSLLWFIGCLHETTRAGEERDQRRGSLLGSVVSIGAVMILAFSLVSLHAGELPRWLGWFGVVASIAALASIVFLTMFVWLLWIAVTSLVLFTRARGNAGEPPVLRP